MRRFVSKRILALIGMGMCFLTMALCLHTARAAESSSTIGSDRYAEMRRRIDEYLAVEDANSEKLYGEKGAFSGAILVAIDGEEVLSRAFGYANREWKIPNTIDTKFRLWSITKIFTATAIMQLHEQGKLGMDDAICKYLDRCPETWQPITIRQLLSHTSGLPEMGEGWPNGVHSNLYRTRVTAAEILQQQRVKPLKFKPGARFSYNNFGFFVAGLIMEKVTGKSYEEALEAQIFIPLRMQDTGLDRPETILPKRASYYQNHLTDEQRRNGLAPNERRVLANDEFYDLPSWMFSAGALYSTVEDMLKFAGGLRSGALLPQLALDQMWTDENNVSQERGYGLGWETHQRAGRRYFSHVGAGRSACMWFMHFPDDGVDIVILANTSGIGRVPERLPDIVLEQIGR